VTAYTPPPARRIPCWVKGFVIGVPLVALYLIPMAWVGWALLP